MWIDINIIFSLFWNKEEFGFLNGFTFFFLFFLGLLKHYYIPFMFNIIFLLSYFHWRIIILYHCNKILSSWWTSEW